MIFVIDDNKIMAECIARACADYNVCIFDNAISAMEAINNDEIPEVIFLDILLDGPDGFTFLNELVSYTDTAKIPIVIVTSLNLREVDLSIYGVVGILNKDIMLPEDIRGYASKYCKK